MAQMKERMRIAQFTNTYHPMINGVVRSVSTFRRALIELGHDVFIFAQQDKEYEDTEPFVFRYPAVDLPLLPNFPLSIPISPFVDKLLPSLKPQVIHAHHPVLLGQAAASKAEELDLPLVFTFHTRYREYSHYVTFISQDFVKAVIDRWVGEYIQKCHHIVVPSESIKEILTDEYGVTEQVTVIPTGIDLEPYQQADGQSIRRRRGWQEETILISVGRLAKEKNWRTLLAAVAQVLANHNDVRLVLIGEGEDRAGLEAYVQELGIATHVEFTGGLPFVDIPQYLSAADLFCFASVTETQGLVTMEALAAGLPVVAVNGSGTRDVVEYEQQGLLTDNDSQALAQAIQRVIDDQALKQRFAQAATEKARSFEAKHLAKKLVAVYEQAQEDKQADRNIEVDRHRSAFKLIDEEQWSGLLGLGSKPFPFLQGQTK
jgi:glycosyltransferase involved in cell wall biosynthesis